MQAALIFDDYGTAQVPLPTIHPFLSKAIAGLAPWR